MSRGVYSVSTSIAAITTAKTLIQLKAGPNTSIELLRAWITNGSVTADDNVEGQILRKTAAATVTSFTPLKFNPLDGAADSVGGAAATGTNASAEGTDGDILVREGFSILAGWVWLPTPEERMIVPPAGFLALKSAITVASVTIICGMVFREVG